MRNRFDLSYTQLSTFDVGKLHPIGMTEVLPGDVVRSRTVSFLRAQPLVRPLMHSVKFNIRSFFVPYRLVWEHWEAFRNEEPGHVIPSSVFSGGADRYEVIDALGGTYAAGQTFSQLPLWAYNLIVNEKYYSRHDFIEDRPLDSLSIADALWENDYFTSARSSPQMGDEAEIPLTLSSTTAPVRGAGNDYTSIAPTVANTGQPLRTKWSHDGQGTGYYGAGKAVYATDAAGVPQLEADLSNLAAESGISISDLRRAVQTQKFAELREKIGDEYVDWLRAVGVRPQDSRFRKPEYLGGGSRTLAFSEVISTAATTDATLGEMAGQGAGYLSHRPWTFYAPEDGCVITIASVVPTTVYSDAQNKAFMRLTEQDFWSPRREGIGDQPILNKEVYARHSDPDGIFGYQDRHGDYMRSFDRVTGDFRKGIEMPAWHWARMFTSDPALNSRFVQADPSERVFADSNTSHFICQSAHEVIARRSISTRKVL